MRKPRAQCTGQCKCILFSVTLGNIGGKSNCTGSGRNQVSCNEGTKDCPLQNLQNREQTPADSPWCQQGTAVQRVCSLQRVANSCCMDLVWLWTWDPAQQALSFPGRWVPAMFPDHQGKTVEVLRHRGMRYHTKKLFPVLPAWLCNKPTSAILPWEWEHHKMKISR